MALARLLHWLLRLFLYLSICVLLSRFWPFVGLFKSALRPCGDAYYYEEKFTCYNGNFLCPVVDGERTRRCGDRCYLPSTHSCRNGKIVAPEAEVSETCNGDSTSLHLSDPPYEDSIYFDCHSASQVVVTSPLPSSDLALIGPRLLVAWPAGNSGLMAYFAPEKDVNGSLALSLAKASSDGNELQPIYEHPESDSMTGNPRVGVTGILNFNTSAILTLPILGSVRTMRDFVEGPSVLQPVIQEGVATSLQRGGGATMSRVWLDNQTTTELFFTPYDRQGSIIMKNGKLVFKAGAYRFNATFDYEQLYPLNSSTVLNPTSKDLITQQSDATKSLAFLSYTEKLLAGAWRFLTYFGRDSMITLLLLQPILSQGEGGAVEAVISSVLEHINGADGTVCHEETIGDYATFLHWENNITSNEPLCNYVMIDTDYFLPIVMQNYFLQTDTGRDRKAAFLAKKATLPFGNIGTTYGDLALINAEKIMEFAAPFAAPGGQVQENLQQLLPGQHSGQWRDSNAGLGGGRIPFDVNTSLIPAALRAISALAAAGFFPSHPDWAEAAASYAQIWEDYSLPFFSVTVPTDEAKAMVTSYVAETSFPGPSYADNITDPLTYYAISLTATEKIQIMHTDTSFHLFLLNTTTNDAQLTTLLDATATHLLLPYPAGLLTDIGLLVANPVYAPSGFSEIFSRKAYHGTVVWGWPMAMMAKGLERQLERCSGGATGDQTPGFCRDERVYSRVKAAYNRLWDVIEANRPQLSQEVWSWTYEAGKGYEVTPLGAFSATESDIVQLWSLAYLAVTRNEKMR